MVTDLEAGLVSEAVAGHRRYKHAASDGAGPRGRCAGGWWTLNLFDLNPELLAALLNVNGADLSGEGFVMRMVRISGAVSDTGPEPAAREDLDMVGGRGQGRAALTRPGDGVRRGDFRNRTFRTDAADTWVRGVSATKCQINELTTLIFCKHKMSIM